MFEGKSCPHCRDDAVVEDGLAHGMCQLCWSFYAQRTFQEYLSDKTHPTKLNFFEYVQKLGQPDGVGWLNGWERSQVTGEGSQNG